MPCRTLYSTTRLNGMPIQTFAMITETSDHPCDVSQCTGSVPFCARGQLTMPESLLSIHDQVDAETISGNNHGTRKSARRVADSRKFWAKKTARAIPMLNCKRIDTRVNTTVCSKAGPKVGWASSFA